MTPSLWTRAADKVALATQFVEDALHDDPGAVVLEGFEPSLQLDMHSCGAQSAFMVLRWFGRARSVDAVTRALGTTTDGTDEGAIVRLLRARGLRVRIHQDATMKTIESAIRAGSPALVCLDEGDGHYAVVYGFSRQFVRLADPSWRRSVRTIVPRAEFRERWAPWRWALVPRKV